MNYIKKPVIIEQEEFWNTDCVLYLLGSFGGENWRDSTKFENSF